MERAMTPAFVYRNPHLGHAYPWATRGLDAGGERSRIVLERVRSSAETRWRRRAPSLPVAR